MVCMAARPSLMPDAPLNQHHISHKPRLQTAAKEGAATWRKPPRDNSNY